MPSVVPGAEVAQNDGDRDPVAGAVGANHSSPQVGPGFHHREHRDHRDGSEGRKVRIRIRNPFLPASVPSVPSVVRLRIAPAAVKFRENRGSHLWVPVRPMSQPRRWCISLPCG
jgi:hypothetical protein